MNLWVITKISRDDSEFNTKIVLKNFFDEQIALEEFRSMYMKEILKNNRFTQLAWDIELECYGPDIIDAIHHTPKKKFSYYVRESINDVNTWTFTKNSNQELHEQFLKFIKDSDDYSKKHGFRHN
jgi:hypothetical protein